MFWLFVLLACDFSVVGVVLCMLGLRSRAGLRMSSLWGMRTKKTMRNEETFRKANLAIWRTYIFQGCLCIACGLAALIVGILNDEAYSILAMIALGSLIILFPSVIYSYHKAHRSIQ